VPVTDVNAPYDGLIDSFERSLRARNRSSKTIRSYIDAAQRFAAFGARHGFPDELTEIRRSHVEEFITDQLQRWSSSTAASRYRYLQQFFKYALDEGEIDSSPMANMSPPRVSEQLPAVLSETQLSALLAACKGPAIEDRRDLAMVRVLLDTGMRLGELTGLTLDDADLDSGTLVITGKGGRKNLVTVGYRCVEALDRYQRARRKRPRSAEPGLWLGPKGTLTSSGVSQAIKRRGRAAGLGDIHVHQFRHTFAHRWMAAGGPEHELMAVAGWQSSQMLGRYGASAKRERAAATARRLGLGDSL
jgi:site-specific recombinase XerD